MFSCCLNRHRKRVTRFCTSFMREVQSSVQGDFQEVSVTRAEPDINRQILSEDLQLSCTPRVAPCIQKKMDYWTHLDIWGSQGCHSCKPCQEDLSKNRQWSPQEAEKQCRGWDFSGLSMQAIFTPKRSHFTFFSFLSAKERKKLCHLFQSKPKCYGTKEWFNPHLLRFFINIASKLLCAQGVIVLEEMRRPN